MTVDLRLLPPGIDDARSRAVLELIERVATLDLTPLLTTRVDSVVADALIHLAWQYHVTGLEGYDLAAGDAAKRELLRQAIELHRYKGTPWAIKHALSSAGYADVTIDESVGRRRHNGQFRHNAEIRHAGEIGWALFRVIIGDLDDDHMLTESEQTLLTAIIDEMKNARSRLEVISFAQPVSDAIAAPDDPAMALSVVTYPLADGTFFADGSVGADGIAAPLELVA